MNSNCKIPVVFQNIAMIDALQGGDFVFDVTLAAWIFYSHCFSFSLFMRFSGLEYFTVRSFAKKTVAFLAETDSQTSTVNQLKLTITST